MVNYNFWKGKRVFITGHTGFKGSWFSQWLLKLGAIIKGYSLEPPTKPALFDVLDLKTKMEHVIADIRDSERLYNEIKSFKPEFIFHLAAQPIVRLSYKEPVLTYETNVMGTINLYEAVRKVDSVKVVVTITTDKCYENKEWVWGYRENEPLGGYDPYSSSKACAEIVTSAYRNSYFNPNDYGKTHHVALASARAGNVIGGGDWAVDRLIPDCVRFLLAGQPVLIRSPNAIRPWQHVLEPLSGYMMLAGRLYEQGPAFAEAWNFGPEDADVKPVEWIVKRICGLWGDNASYTIAQGPQSHEATYLKLDISKAKQRLNWKPVWSLDKALTTIIGFSRSDDQCANLDKTICEFEELHNENI